MHVVVTGATGNVGTALLAELAGDPLIQRITGVARRPPRLVLPRTWWISADVGRDDLTEVVRGADAVVHLAWAIQPSRRPAALWRTNVIGSARVAGAAAAAGVRSLIHASSVGVYSPGPKDRAVDEDWPREGTPSSLYARHKAEVEHLLDDIELQAPTMRIVRMRPGLTFSRGAATGVRRLFIGSLVPRALLRPRRIPLVPDLDGLRVQALHSSDVARAYRRVLHCDAAGAFNLAADPVLDPRALAHALGARRVRVAAPLARAVVALSWRARLQPTHAGWLDLARAVPLVDSSRARRELDWVPEVSSTEALLELLSGMSDGAGRATPPLAPATRRWV
jgi:nucleoside-diphosphate-sugar epimerase